MILKCASLLAGIPQTHERSDVVTEHEDDDQPHAPLRRRRIMKGVYFDDAEWAKAEAAMARGGWRSFSDFAREMILSRKVVVNERTLDVAAVRAALAPIGNNVNQIARKANVDDFASLEQLEAVRFLLGQIETTLERYVRGGGDGGRSEDGPDSSDAE